MIEGLPNWINGLFLLTVVATIVLFYFANGQRKPVLWGFFVWSVLHSVLAYNEFYQITDTIPPRFILVLAPTTVLIVISLLPRYRKIFFTGRNRTISTFLHTSRIPVEIVLFYLFVYGMVPELMTFEGRNFDILAGLTAPAMGLLVYYQKARSSLLIAWNLVSLALVCFILVNGILSSELPFQQFAFEQPNRAILYFPFILLPAVVVPIILYTHLTDLIILLHERKTPKRSKAAGRESNTSSPQKVLHTPLQK